MIQKKQFNVSNVEKVFCNKMEMQDHQMNVHLKMRPYKCRYRCIDNIGYNDLGNRNSHERKKHGGVFKDVEQNKLLWCT